MNSDEHDDLWQLLGKAQAPHVSPFFSRNVLRTLRLEQQEARPRFGWLRRWHVGALGMTAVLAAAFFFLAEPADSPDPVGLLASQVTSSPDLHVIGHLDELLDSELNSVWLENSAY